MRSCMTIAGISPSTYKTFRGFSARHRRKEPPLASTVYLLMDIDVSGAGEAAVNNTATRLHQQGRAVKIVRPTIGKDFNDAIRGETYV